MTDAPETPEDDDALAAEYVLRLMDDLAAVQFEARLASDANLRAQVAIWEADLAHLAESIDEVTPPPAIKTKLFGTLFPQVAPKRSFMFWAVPLGLAAFAVMAFFVLSPIFRTPDFNPAYHASLASGDGVLQIEAGFAPDSNLFKLLRPQGDALPGRALELWVIAEGAAAPVSMGVLPEAREILFELDPGLVPLIRGGTLAVSDEPLGGSPTGAPTGDVLAAAPLLDI